MSVKTVAGLPGRPCPCFSSNIDCWNDQISRNITEKDRHGVTISWEYQNMLKKSPTVITVTIHFQLTNSNKGPPTWPALLSHITHVTGRAWQGRVWHNSLASLLTAHWLLIPESFPAVTTMLLRDRGVTCECGTCCGYHQCSQHNLGSSSGTICLIVNASECHHYFIEEDKYLTFSLVWQV